MDSDPFVAARLRMTRVDDHLWVRYVRLGPIAHIEYPETREVRRQPPAEIGKVAAGARRPQHFGERTRSWKRHVLDVLRSLDVLRPDLSLSAENVLREPRLELG